MKRRVFFGVVGSLLAPWMAPALARACAVCLTGANDATAEAFNWSILFLMIAPYLVFGSIGTCLYILYRRSMARRAADEAAQSVTQLAFSQKESGR